MGKVSFAKWVDVSGGEKGFTPLYTVPAARTLTVKRVQVFFPVGDYGELKLALYFGNSQRLPRQGYYQGDGCLVIDETEAKWPSGSEVKLYYENENETETRSAYILVEGELE